MASINRRSLITGLVSLVAAPAIVRVTSIMPVRAIITECVTTGHSVWRGHSLSAAEVEAFCRRMSTWASRHD